MAVEELGSRWEAAISVALLTIIMNALGGAMNSNLSGELGVQSGMVAVLLQSPTILSLIGVLAALIFAGPPGFIGSLLEGYGASIFINEGSTLGLKLLIFGSVMVFLSSLVPWLDIYMRFLNGGSGGYRAPPGR